MRKKNKVAFALESWMSVSVHNMWVVLHITVQDGRKIIKSWINLLLKISVVLVLI